MLYSAKEILFIEMARKKIRQPRSNRGKGIAKDSSGTRFISDFVYEGQTTIDKVVNYGTRFGENPRLEFEYDRQYLVYTVTGGEEIKRTVYIGNFDISRDGIIKRATVSEERIGTAYPGMPPYAPDYENVSNIYRHPTYTLDNVDGLVSFWTAGVTAKDQIIDEIQPISTLADPINQKFFPNEWWNNPFASNLL
jgi:hypothetical protein